MAVRAISFFTAATLFTVAALNAQVQQIFPHIAADSGWQTEIYVDNTSTQTATFSIAFHTDNGTTLALDGNPQITNVSLAPRGSAYFKTAATTQESGGYAVLTSNVALSGTAVFTRVSAGSVYSADVPLGETYTAFSVPFDETADATDQFVEGLAITNPGSASTIVSCTPYAPNGSMTGVPISISLKANSHTAVLLDTIFGPVLVGQRGQLSCTSPQPVAALEIRADNDNPSISSLEVAPGGALTGTWQGTITSAAVNLTAQLSVVISQAGSSLTATSTITGANPSCGSASTSFGAISGSNVIMETVSSAGTGGIIGVVNGNSITGEYSVVTGPCAGDYGTFSITK